MPCGITHILLSQQTRESLSKDNPLRRLLFRFPDFMLLGSIAPDLPYASEADNDVFHEQKRLADQFHYHQTNQIPLEAFRLIKKMNAAEKASKAEIEASFAFFSGYASHVVADAIFHPFIRDKVGEYADNPTGHRALEMDLDVIFLHKTSEGSGEALEINYTNIAGRLANVFTQSETQIVLQVFRELIKTVYGITFTADQIKLWVGGMARLLNVASGKRWALCRGGGLCYRNFNDFSPKQMKESRTLEKPLAWKRNFRGGEKVDFFDDCVPQFHSYFDPLIQKAYNHVFAGAEKLGEKDLPALNLDNGCPLTPFYWSK